MSINSLITNDYFWKKIHECIHTLINFAHKWYWRIYPIRVQLWMIMRSYNLYYFVFPNQFYKVQVIMIYPFCQWAIYVCVIHDFMIMYVFVYINISWVFIFNISKYNLQWIVNREMNLFEMENVIFMNSSQPIFMPSFIDLYVNHCPISFIYNVICE